ncbi:MAG: Gfo/Idh/MocA family oxidoreductase [Xanthobacteraceae bacterium]
MPPRVRSGIIGLGNWGKNVARELHAASDLVAFASRSSSGQEAWLSEHLPAVRRTTPDGILDDPSIQAIAIVTPIPLLSTFAHAALEAGKHTFVEKPLAQSSEIAGKLADLAMRRGLIFSAGYVFLYHPVYMELKRRVKLQSIRNIKLEWRKFGTFTESIEQSLLAHHLSLILDLVGEPASGRIDYGPGVYTTCDKIETHLGYPDFNAVSLIDRSISLRSAHRMTLEMNDGSSLIWEDNLLSSIDDKNAKPIVVYETKCTALAAEIAGFIDAAAGGDPELPTAGSFAARVLRVLERLREVR